MRLVAIVVLLALLWAAGLFAFSARVAASTPAQDPAVSQGIVALTGPGARIEAAVQLLERGKGQRLLVSGVNREVSRQDIQRLTHDYGHSFDCCVDLGFRAADTQGNARETSGWTRYHHIRTLIVVTADYHMPRALLELRAALPGVTLRPYPIATSTLDARRWWRSAEGARRMTYEYCKYLVILSRETVLSLGAKRESLVVETPTNATAKPVTDG